MATKSLHSVFYSCLVLAALLALTAFGSRCFGAASSTPNSPSSLWVTGYYIAGDAESGRYPLSKIDFHALTHIIDFCNFPGPSGTLDPQRTIPEKHSREILAAAHAANCKVIVSLGSDDGLKNFREDISDQFRDMFVKALIDFVVSRGYDGLDLDYEPVSDADVPNFTLFVQGLRKEMDTQKPGLLLTVAAADQPKMYAVLQNCFNQINLMTYDMSGPWLNFKSWYNSNLYGNPYERMQNYRPYPSTDDMVQQYLDAGVNRSKLAIGVAFYGYIWSGISGPKQSVKGLTDADIDDGADYRMIMDKYYKPSAYHWDPIAHSCYLSIKAASKKDSKFISFDDPRTCAEKVNYVKNNGLGGMMIWEIGAGYRPSQPPGQQDVMLQTLKMATHTESGL